ncbi:hypothetical protein QYE76_009998 [Lolium multiflorum]|uniref:CCHC-type domain-containing protein n=1 Tax=Lolium multiflorum TaxID=4521 RepID=A0AAD8X1Q3_LOLMU|nr:hypothetical protein QYE76_009998 [Lolium multiflorum]
MSSPSSSSRRWADYTDDEEDEVPRRSYCEVLRSGTPPVESGSGAASSSIAQKGVASPAPTPGGVVCPVAAAVASGPWAVDEGVRRLASLAVLPARRASPPAARPPGARAGTARGHKRPRGQATLPAWTVRSGIPSNLAGACFNCTRTCHISAECTYETVCLRCGDEGHHARACPQNRRAGGDRREAQHRGSVVQEGQPAHQRQGVAEQPPPVSRERGSSSASEHVAHVEAAPGGSGVEPPPPPARYRIPARQRCVFDAQPLHQSTREESPPPVDAETARLPARLRLGVRGRSPPPPSLPPPPPPPPLVLETVGSSLRAARGKAVVHEEVAERRRPVQRDPGAARQGASDVEFRRARPRGEARGGQERRGHQAAESVFVARTAEVDGAEEALRYALVAFVAGSRAYIPLGEAGAALVARVPRAEDNFTVHRSGPGDFLFVCSSRRVHDEIMAGDAAHGRDFSLRFTPWNRQLQAMQCKLRFRVHFELTGVPAHAWNRTTATAVLSSNAWVECLGAAMANREDLDHFQVVSWTNNVSAFPKSKDLLVEEPGDRMEEDEGLVLPGSALIPLEKTMLRYSVTVRVVHAEDMIPAEDWSGDSSGGSSDEDGGDGGSGRRRSWEDEPGRRHGRRGSSRDERGRDRGHRDRRHASRSRRGDVLRRRPSDGSGWGGSRRVALNVAADVSPWPEVDDDDMERGSGMQKGGLRLEVARTLPVCMQGAGEDRWQPATDSSRCGDRCASSRSPRGKASCFSSDRTRRGDGGVGVCLTRGGDGLDPRDIRCGSPGAGPAEGLKAAKTAAPFLETSGLSTPGATRGLAAEEEWEEGECRSGFFVVNGSALPPLTGLAHSDQTDPPPNCQLSRSGIVHTPPLQSWTSPEVSVDPVEGGSPTSVLDYFQVSISPPDKELRGFHRPGVC